MLGGPVQYLNVIRRNPNDADSTLVLPDPTTPQRLAVAIFTQPEFADAFIRSFPERREAWVRMIVELPDLVALLQRFEDTGVTDIVSDPVVGSPNMFRNVMAIGTYRQAIEIHL